MALLIGRDDLVGNGIITQIGLAKTIGQTGDFAAIRRNAQNRARRAPDGAPGLTGFANNKAPVLHDLEGGSEFPGLGSLVDLRAKELVIVRLAVTVTVMKTPEPVSVEDEDFLIPQPQAQRLVQTGCKTGPFHLLGTGSESFPHPNVPVKGYQSQSTILEEIDAGGPDGPTVGVFQRQRNAFEIESLLFLLPLQIKTDRFFPTATLDS